MMGNTIHLTMSPRLPKALSALSNILKSRSEVVDLLVHFRNTFVQFGRIDCDRFVTARTFDGGVCLEPSNSLLDFLLAAWAGDFDSVRVDVDSHGSPFHE